MQAWRSLFSRRPKCNILAMVHVMPTPGTPAHTAGNSVEQAIDVACREAEIYSKAGVDGVLVENANDAPYVPKEAVGPEVTAYMTAVCREVRKVVPASIPVGVQVLAGCNEEAVAVASAAGLQFVRAEAFIFAHVADEGLMNGCAGSLLRYRKAIGADGLLVFADLKKKHSAHAITADVGIVDTAVEAKFNRADGVVITGSSTGAEADASDLNQVLDGVPDMPVLIGSGVTDANIGRYSAAHGLVVGSFFKTGGHYANNVEPERVEKLLEAREKLSL